MREWGIMNPGFSAVENPQNAGNQPMRIQDSFPPISDLSEPKKNTLKSNSFDVFKGSRQKKKLHILRTCPTKVGGYWFQNLISFT